MKTENIILLQRLANQLPNVFIDPKSVTKLYIPIANVLIKMNVFVKQFNIANES